MIDDPDGTLPLLRVDEATAAEAARITRRDHCACLSARKKDGAPREPNMHAEPQDMGVPGWRKVEQLVDQTKRARSTRLEPSAHLPWDEWMQVITLPTGIASLIEVRTLFAYGSHLRRLPPEVGRMSSLEDLDIYTSYSLHWLPYEVTRCAKLRRSRMSTRALYGNRNTRLPFPKLTRPIDALLPQTCSVCDRPFGEKAPQVFWLTLNVATDIVPLLVHSCSKDCTLSLPRPPDHYFERPHKGGDGIGMPEKGYGRMGSLWGGERVTRIVRDAATGEERWTWFTVHVNRESGEVSYIPDAGA